MWECMRGKWDGNNKVEFFLQTADKEHIFYDVVHGYKVHRLTGGHTILVVWQ